MQADYEDPDWMLPIRKAVDEKVRHAVHNSGQMTLGIFIAELEKLPRGNSVVYDVLSLRPTDLDSYRGYYDHLAFGFTEADNIDVSVGDILDKAKAAMGRTFEGYKGGEYVMNERTPLWVANYGHSAGLRIIEVDTYRDTKGELSAWTIIRTAKEED